MGTITTVEGTAYWAQVQATSQFDTFSITLGNLDEVNSEKISKSFTSHRLKSGPGPKDQDFGDSWASFSRKGADGKPAVVGPDGATPFTGLIGNGSTVRIQYESWQSKDSKFANGHRLLGVQVLTLVPYGVQAEASFGDESNEYEALPETGVMNEVVFGEEE